MLDIVKRGYKLEFQAKVFCYSSYRVRGKGAGLVRVSPQAAEAAGHRSGSCRSGVHGVLFQSILDPQEVWRPVLELHSLNRYLNVRNIRMESLLTIVKAEQPG